MYPNYLSEADFKNLQTYSYQSAPYTWLDKKMKPFWVLVASCVPRVSKFNLNCSTSLLIFLLLQELYFTLFLV